MAVLIKNITTYQKTKPSYDAYRRAKDRGSYRAAHERDIILYEAAVKAIKGAGISKLPDIAALQTEYAKLQERKEALYADYGKLKKQVKEYDVIKRNIDSILRQPESRNRRKERNGNKMKIVDITACIRVTKKMICTAWNIIST